MIPEPDQRAATEQAVQVAAAEQRPAAGQGAAAEPRKRKAAPVPLIGGRLWIALGMVLGVGLVANPPFSAWVTSRFGPPPEHTDMSGLHAGAIAHVKLTLVTADAARLSCAHETPVEGAHCAFRDEKTPWPRDPAAPVDDNNAEVIQPYRTAADNKLLLVAGLWAVPAVAMRLHREPPRGVPIKALNRFTAACRVKILGRLENLKLRWDPTGKWQDEKSAWIARAESCTIPIE